MIAIRTYWNPAEAALEKTLLDNYEVTCALFHENANLYGRAPMAMPIRLVVREDQADWAVCILNGNFEAAAALERIPTEMPAEQRVIVARTARKQAVGAADHGFLFLFAGDLFFANTVSNQAFSYSRGAGRNCCRSGRSFLGWIAITFALILFVLFQRSWRPSLPNTSDEAR